MLVFPFFTAIETTGGWALESYNSFVPPEYNLYMIMNKCMNQSHALFYCSLFFKRSRVMHVKLQHWWFCFYVSQDVTRLIRNVLISNVNSHINISLLPFIIPLALSSYLQQSCTWPELTTAQPQYGPSSSGWLKCKLWGLGTLKLAGIVWDFGKFANSLAEN